ISNMLYMQRSKTHPHSQRPIRLLLDLIDTEREREGAGIDSEVTRKRLWLSHFSQALDRLIVMYFNQNFTLLSVCILPGFAPPGYNYLNQSPSIRALISWEICVFISEAIDE
ncbi:ubiquitin-like protein 5, partial [Prunus dulcis]